MFVSVYRGCFQKIGLPKIFSKLYSGVFTLFLSTVVTTFDSLLFYFLNYMSSGCLVENSVAWAYEIPTLCISMHIRALVSVLLYDSTQNMGYGGKGRFVDERLFHIWT